jgi:hypothetical protein
MLFDIYLTRTILGTPARIFFGNDAGLKENILGQKEYRQNYNGISQSSNSIELAVDGYTKLGKPFSPQLINAIQKTYIEKLSLVDTRPNATYVEIRPALMEIPELAKLVEGKVGDVLREYYEGINFRVTGVAAWRNYSWGEEGKTKDINSNLWHNDQYFVHALKLFVFLSDGITSGNGGTKLLSIKNTKKVMRTGYFQRNYIFGIAKRLLTRESSIDYFEGDLGSAFIFNPQLCVHGAGLVSPGKYRDVAVISFRPNTSELPDNWADEIIKVELEYLNRVRQSV